MKPPTRLTDGAASGLGARLVRAARADAPPATSRQRAIAAAALAGATMSSMSGGAAAGGTLAGGGLAKWLAWGLGSLVLAVAIGAAVVAGKGGEPATPGTPAVTASPVSMPVSMLVPPSSTTPADKPEAPEIVAIPVESLPLAPTTMPAPRASSRPVAAALASATTTPPHAELAPAADPPAARSTLTQEIALLDDAKSALDASQPDAALVILDRHAREFPHGALGPEATAVRIEALYRRGDRAAAAGLFRTFEEKNPTSPVLDHVRSFAGSAPKAE